MNTEFTYTNGTWSEGHILSEVDSDQDFNFWLKSLGYIQVRAYGYEYSDPMYELIIYKNENDSTFFASILLNEDTPFEVLITDFPSLMQFIKDYSTSFSTEAVRQEIERLTDSILEDTDE